MPRTPSTTTARPAYESGRAYDVFNASGTQESRQNLFIVAQVGSGTVDDSEGAAAVADIVARTKALTSTVGGAAVPTFDQVVDPLTAPAEAGLVSPDRTTVRVVASFPDEGVDVEERLAPVPAFLDELRAAHPDLRIHGLNNTLANDDISNLVNDDLDNSLRITIPLTFVILLIAFGAAVAAFVPLILAVTSLLAAFGVLALYSQFISPVSPYASQLVVLIGLAVAVDYSLFMITRFRTERRRRDKLPAIATASSTAGRAVFFSGLAVMISIGGLFLLDDPLFRSMAIGTISVVFISVVGSLTFLPAILSILDRERESLRAPVHRPAPRRGHRHLGHRSSGRRCGAPSWPSSSRPASSWRWRHRSCACTSGRATSPRSPIRSMASRPSTS